jgi:hypothetical protein
MIMKKIDHFVDVNEMIVHDNLKSCVNCKHSYYINDVGLKCQMFDKIIVHPFFIPDWCLNENK